MPMPSNYGTSSPRSNKSVNPPPGIPEERVEGAILIRSMITRRLGGETEEEAIIDPLFLSPYSIHPAIYKKTEGVKKRRQSSLRLLTTNPSKSLITADPLGVGSCSETAAARPSDTVFRTMSREQIQYTSPVPGRVCNGDLHSVRRAWNTREILKHIGIIHL